MSVDPHPQAMASEIAASSSPLKRLEGKVALVTGAASGIGGCTARLLFAHGAKVVIADIQDDLGTAVARELGDSATFVHCDVTDEDDVRNAVDTAVSVYGKLDIMHNNAGMIDPQAPLVDAEKSVFERVIAVNLTGAFVGTKHAARVMIPARKGCIISTASIAAMMGGLAPHAYTCAKHAIVGMTRNAAVELGQYGIRVNCVSPFAVATPMAMAFFGSGKAEDMENLVEAFSILKGAVLRAEDVANAVLYLASDEAKYVTGHNLVVDGGFTITNPSLAAYKNNQA